MASGAAWLAVASSNKPLFYPLQFSSLCNGSCNTYLEYSTEAVISLKIWNKAKY